VDEAGENPGVEAPRTLGAAFAAERERQGLAPAEVAQRLHMSPTQVEALEREDYEHLPKGTFLRGFVRNYAKVLGVEADPLLALLEGATPRQPAPRIVVPTQNIRFDPLGERLGGPYVKAGTLALVAVALGFAAMYWAMYVRPGPPVQATKVEPQPPKAEEPAPAAPPPATQAQPAEPASAPAAGSGALPAAGSAVAPAPRPVPAAPGSPPSASPALAAAASFRADGAGAVAPEKPVPGGKRLQFHFVGESWVEVRDARGRIVFQRLNPAGTDAEVAGRPPLEVVVGNAPEVKLTYDGRPFDLEPHTNVAVARFTLE
jgi:cytoskeleton protein RodZ